MKHVSRFARSPAIRTQDEEVSQGLEAGATAYILKPFSPDDLTKRVADILKQAGVAN
jgi:DNA-binding response OmpR family regulator